MLAVDYGRGERLCSTICRKNQSNEKYLERGEKSGTRTRRVFEGFIIELELKAGQSAMVNWVCNTHELCIKHLQQGIMVKPGLISRFWSAEHPQASCQNRRGQFRRIL